MPGLVEARSLSNIALNRTLGMPDSGPKCVPIKLDFSIFPTYTIDFSNATNLGYFDAVQTVWVDNFGNAQILKITVQGSQQVLQIPAGAQGYFPCMCPNAIRMQFDSTGGTVQQVTLLNFPVFA